MSKHTPGPWIAVRTEKLPEIGWPVVHLGGWWIHTPPMRGDNYGTEAGDAHLIAAAPELLEALKEAHDLMLREDFATLTLVRKLAAIIAKAEGRL